MHGYEQLLDTNEGAERPEIQLCRLAEPPIWPTDEFSRLDQAGMQYLEEVAADYAEEAADLSAVTDGADLDGRLRQIARSALPEGNPAYDNGASYMKVALALGVHRMPLGDRNPRAETPIGGIVKDAIEEIALRLLRSLVTRYAQRLSSTLPGDQVAGLSSSRDQEATSRPTVSESRDSQNDGYQHVVVKGRIARGSNESDEEWEARVRELFSDKPWAKQ